jgi:hypothetical protein
VSKIIFSEGSPNTTVLAFFYAAAAATIIAGGRPDIILQFAAWPTKFALLSHAAAAAKARKQQGVADSARPFCVSPHPLKLPPTARMAEADRMHSLGTSTKPAMAAREISIVMYVYVFVLAIARQAAAEINQWLKIIRFSHSHDGYCRKRPLARNTEII